MLRFSQHALFCSSGLYSSNQIVSGGVDQLSRVQSTNLSLSWPRIDETYLNESVERARNGRPNVNLTYEYLATAGYNEQIIGLVTDGVNSAFWNLNQEKNYFVLAKDAFTDANLDSGSSQKVIGIGQALLNGYSIAASAGDLVKTTCTLEALNLLMFTGNSGQNPAVVYQNGQSFSGGVVIPPAQNLVYSQSSNPANDIVALGAKDLIMEFPSGSVFGTLISGTNACQLQSFTLAFSISRNQAKPLGFAYPNERRVNFPIIVELSADAFLEQYQIDALNTQSCFDSGHNINILVKQPCSDLLALEFYLKGLKLDSQQINTSTQSNFSTVSFTWKGLIGNLNDSGNNVYIKANNGAEYYELESVTPISGLDVNGDFFFSEQSFYRRKLAENNFFSGSVI
jgi:hypothetical protein